jgi:hypothetical protein
MASHQSRFTPTARLTVEGEDKHPFIRQGVGKAKFDQIYDKLGFCI